MTAQAPIAVVLDSPFTPAWQASVVEALDASRSVAVCELRLVGASAPIRGGMARRLRTALEKKVFATGRDPQLAVAVAPREPSQPAQLVLWLAERTSPAGETADLVTVRHDGFSGPADGAFGRALLSRQSCLESDIVLSRGATAYVLARTVSEVRPFSETLSRTLALWKLAAMVPRSLERLFGTSEDLSVLTTSSPRASAPAGALASKSIDELDTSSPPPPPPPEIALLIRACVSVVRALITRILFRRPWSILVAEGDASLPAVEPDFGDDLVRWGDARMYADPFLFAHEGRHHLFCEEVPSGEKQGVISHTELRLDGSATAPPTPVLRTPHHLSYPFVFAHEGEVFMIPETSAARRVELYRARAFPYGWEREAILLEDLNAADATLLAHDGLLWLFASVAAPGASTLDELHLFWARELRGPWHRHPLNPIVSDVHCARPAGAIQRWGSRLVRPAQDCSRRYGWAISFREIDLLSTTAYAEHELDRIEPSALKGARATHTYSSDGRFQALDVRRREFRVRIPSRRDAFGSRPKTAPENATEQTARP